MRKLTFFTLFIMASFTASAQLPPPCTPGQPPADNCEDACIYCAFSGLNGNTAPFTQGNANGFCGSIENEQWLGFIAGASEVTFIATPINCNTGDGIQIALYDNCSGTPVDCAGGQQGGGGTPVELVDVPLTPGANYYLLIDGFGGDQCTFNVTLDPPNGGVAPPLPPSIGPIHGPSMVCPGAVINYSIPDVPNAGAYTWTVPNGWLINGQSSPQQVLAIDGGASVQITVGPTGGTICVRAANSCYPNGPQVCKTITVAPIPPTILAPVIVCNEDAPYELPWGTQVTSNGTYQTTMQSYLGCDSIVRQTVTIKPAIFTNLALKTICEGGSIMICGEEYTEAGAYSHLCESYQGCDSLVNFSISVLAPVAQINGSGTLTCSTTSISLTASSSPPGTLYNWKNLTGTTLATGTSLTVTTAGTYILTATMNGGGIQCIKADTIVIVGNTTPPTLTTTGGNLNCTATSVQLNATSNAAPATWIWSGPGAFTASIPNPIATQQGTYTVTVTNGSTGCSATATATIGGNTTPPTLTTVGDTLTCAQTSAQITANPNPTTANYQWAGPNSFTSTIQTPTVTSAGTYTVTITNTVNNCTATATALVTLDNATPGATASSPGTISCTAPSVVLNGGPGTAGNTFSWSGPNSFTSSSQNPSVTAAGTYTITVTGSNGCTSTASAAVAGDVSLPNATASGATLSCETQSIQIQGNSTTTGVTYGWTGPNNFTSALQNPNVTEVGTYILTVTSPNNCSSTVSAEVLGDFAAPDVTATGGTITCSQSSTTISGGSTTNGATLLWSGPGAFTSTQASVSVSTVGDYILTATAPNGCTSTAVASVLPDANLPNATADGDTLNCNINSVTLNGGTTSIGVSLSWTGPNNFTSTLEDPVVTESGTYVLLVTDNNNGCTAQASATVALDVDEPGATAEGDTLTCSAPDLNLVGDSPINNVSWAWSGPNNFSSTQQNPNVSVSGDYTLVVTNLSNGCTSSDVATVALDQVLPVASSNTGTLTCSLDSLTLNGTADVNASFSWTGPGGFSFNGEDAIVVTPGDYILFATSLANGCVDTAIITVAQDIAAPVGTATGDTINCINTSVTISAESPAGIEYEWSGPSSFNSALQNPSVTEGGLYTVTITAANGCTSTAEANVALDTDPPAIIAVSNDFVTCTAPSVNIQTNITSTSPVSTISWTGPNNYTSSDEDALVTEGGVYTIVATLENGCTTQADVTVQEDTALPDVTAAGDTLTCTDTSVTLNGASQTLGAVYLWSGPNNFSSTEEDPAVSVEGVYTVQVTGQNGCTSTTQAIVSTNVVTPGAESVSSNNLDCDDLSTTLTGSSPTGNVQYSWSGPNNFQGTTATVTATLPGTYEVEVTASNGCVSIDTVVVTQDIVDPNAEAVGGTVDCISGQLDLQGVSSTTGATFAWAGPNNFSSTLQNPQVSNPGQYILTVTGPNGCTSVANATVVENTDSPVVTIGGAGTLTCTTLDLTLVSNIQTAGATGVWTGPNNFNASTPDVTVSAPGSYVFTVTATNGCISAPTLTILQDILPPQSVTATGGLLNCSFPTINLDAGSASEVSYSWAGPGNFTSTIANPAVTNPGVYTITFTGLVNGCTATAVATVTQDPTVPTIAVAADSLTCATTSVTLNASASPGVTFVWSGPNNFNSTEEDPQTSAPGAYSVVVTAQNGCTAISSYTVTQNINLPNVSATGDTLTCTQQSGQINSNSTTPNVTYVWTGPGGFNSTLASPSVNIDGIYTVTVTGLNGCTSSTQVTVAPDVNAPVISASGGTINCNIQTITLSATNNIPVTWSWTGPNNFTSTQQNPSVSVPGTYNVSGTAVNGCVSFNAAVVVGDTQAPNISATTPDELDCTTTQVGLNANVSGTGQYTYQWNTQNGVIASGANTSAPQVTQGGIYTVRVTNLLNGCSDSLNVEVLVDPATPSGALYDVDDISCYGETDGVLVINQIEGGTPPFLYSVDNQPFSASTQYTALTPGVHIIQVQDANGCEFETSFTVTEPEEFLVNLGPDTLIHLGDSLLVTLDGITNDTSRVNTIRLTPANFTLDAFFTPTHSVRYQVELIDDAGCRAKDERLIIVNRERWVYIPNIFNPNSTENSFVTVLGGPDVEIVKSFQIFDRWGNAIYEQRNFKPNDPVTGWDGTFKGDQLNPGVFVYYAEIRFIDGETEIFKGDVTLMR